MVTKCKANLVLTNDKGETVFELKDKRRSKLIKVFIEKAVKENWVLKRDLMFSLLGMHQVNTISEFLELKQQIEKGEKQ